MSCRTRLSPKQLRKRDADKEFPVEDANYCLAQKLLLCQDQREVFRVCCQCPVPVPNALFHQKPLPQDLVAPGQASMPPVGVRRTARKESNLSTTPHPAYQLISVHLQTTLGMIKTFCSGTLRKSSRYVASPALLVQRIELS